MNSAITKPITRIIDDVSADEGNILSKFADTKECFATLFSILRLKKATDTLIKSPNIRKVQSRELFSSDQKRKSSLDNSAKKGEKPLENKPLDIDYESLLKLENSEDKDLVATDPPPSFASTLHPYQKQALTW